MLTDADIQLHADEIRDHGFTVIERAADPGLVEGLKQALLRTEREHGLVLCQDIVRRLQDGPHQQSSHL